MHTNNILITGNYRSGTEYLSNLLNGISNVTSEMYATNFLRYYHKSNSITEFKEMIATHLYERKNITLPFEISNKLIHQHDL